MSQKVYFKIEHTPKASQQEWRQSLYQGRLAKFDEEGQASQALSDNKLFPISLDYRIVKVTEEVVIPNA